MTGRLDNPGAGIGLQLRTLSGDKIDQAIQLGFSASNNELKYEAILAGLELVATLFADRLLIWSDLPIGGWTS